MEHSKFFVLIGVLLCCHPIILANEIDTFSSARDIEHLYKNEDHLQYLMQEQLISVQRQAKVLDWFLDTFYGEGYENYTEADAEEYVSNPINTYCLIKRTALHWPRVREVIFNDTVDNQMETLLKVMNETSKPPSQSGAFSGLFAMQQIYNLDIKELSTGKLRVPGQKEEMLTEEFNLTSSDLQEIAKIAFDRGFYDRAFEFYDAAVWKATKDGGNFTDDIPEIQEKLEEVKSAHDKTLMEKGSRGADWSTYLLPFDNNLRRDGRFKEVKGKSYVHTPKLFGTLDKKEDIRDQFNMLCRGEKARAPSHDKNLKCFNRYSKNDYHRFYPFKVEVLNKEPYVAVYHEFLVEKEIDHFISLMPVNKTKTPEEIEKESDMSPEFEFDPILDILKEADEKLNIIKTTPSKKDKAQKKKSKSSKNAKAKKGKTTKEATNDKKGGKKNVEKEASGKNDDTLENTSMEKDAPKAISAEKRNKSTKSKKSKGKKKKKNKGKINNRINMAIGIHEKESDDRNLKVEEFGLGGSYHSNKINNNEVATFTIFLTNIEAGGATVFPNLGITVWPQKGNALFWEHADVNGRTDPRMSFGSCPVLHGTKLGINKKYFH